jgi:hypothetical protein
MSEKLEPIKKGIFNIIITIIYILYFFTFLGITIIDKSKIHFLSLLIEIIICIILMMRFNSFTHHKMTDFDRVIIFSAASFLLVNLVITEIFSQHLNKQNEIINYINTFK